MTRLRDAQMGSCETASRKYVYYHLRGMRMCGSSFEAQHVHRMDHTPKVLSSGARWTEKGPSQYTSALKLVDGSHQLQLLGL